MQRYLAEDRLPKMDMERNRLEIDLREALSELKECRKQIDE
jgi:hypothetical protein